MHVKKLQHTIHSNDLATEVTYKKEKHKNGTVVYMMLANESPVSRSKARRLSLGLDKFETVKLDFSGVEDIGQAFTHELFVVYQNSHPNVELIIQNASKNVLQMIK